MRIKIGWLIGLVVIVIISIGATLYVQHSSFAKDKEIMATNFGKKSKVLNEKINSKEKEINSLKEKQADNEDKIKKLEDEINSLKNTTESSSNETAPETQQENTQVNATSEVHVHETPTVSPVTPEAPVQKESDPDAETWNQINALKAKFDNGEIPEIDYQREVSKLMRELNN
ncbi:hypothetical protein [Carnobacterium maltaromaticum]|uniref:hypothetical protein n=1 Tax=Carnobacterium maltaromaticum TaxID=2751 RepID=UPI00191BBBDF|nr:hypothetical protein [Carnobacterium maltaromaticum]CAD5902375.1 hypothetical protein CMALT394_460003 [Carnobacterium maltaromaticum]